MKVRFDALISSYFGESAANLRSIFIAANERPCVLLLDECDFIARSRTSSHDIGEANRIVNSLLQLMEEYDAPGLLVATTNVESSLDHAPQTIANRNARDVHSAQLDTSAHSLSARWRTESDLREAQTLPILPAGKPLLVQVDPGLDLDVLREKFDFEIVAEQEDGFVLVASEDIDLTAFTEMVSEFAVEVHGSATIAQVHKLDDDPDQLDRLKRVLSEALFEACW